MSNKNNSNRDELQELWSEGLSDAQATELMNLVDRAARVELEQPAVASRFFGLSFTCATFAVVCIALFVVVPMNKTKDAGVFNHTTEQVLSEANFEVVLGDFALLDENDSSEAEQFWIEDFIETL